MEKYKHSFSDVEPGDLDIQLSYGYVLYGSFRDFVRLRNLIRNRLEDSKLVFHTISGEHLYLLKKSVLTEDQIKLLEGKKVGRKKEEG